MGHTSYLKLAAARLFAEFSAIQDGENPYYFGDPPKASHYNPNYRQTGTSKRVLREFKVKGEVVMAYSKKDALKRLNRGKKRR